MKIGSCYKQNTSNPIQLARKLRKVVNIDYCHRLLHRKPHLHNTGKEIDPEIGLYYFGARYLDPKTSRWISGDPALGEYLPSAPVNDEARKRNGSLPGMGGVFNYANLHVYHYAGNNPVKYVDPDGKIFIIRGDIEYIRQVKNDLRTIEKALLRSGNTEAIESFYGIKNDQDFIVLIRMPDSGDENQYDYLGNVGRSTRRPGEPDAQGILSYDPSISNGGINISGNTKRPGFVGLSHEIKHGIDHFNGTYNDLENARLFGEITEKTEYYLSEDSAIKFENTVREGHFGNSKQNRLPAVESHPYW